MRPRIKFCGMTRGVDIDAAVVLGVEYIGLIFVPSSPRSVTMEEARELCPYIHTAQSVGVFTDQSVEDIERHIRVLALDYVQIYGTPDLEKIQRISGPVIQAFRGIPDETILRAFLNVCPYVLLDKTDGKDHADFGAIEDLPSDIRSRLFIAGGITPDNVRCIVDRIQPFAVDSARSIESQPGVKDPYRMCAFFHSLS